MRKITLIALLLSLGTTDALSYDTADVEQFGTSVRLIESGNPTEMPHVIRQLESAEDKVPYIKDYIYFHKARAYKKSGEYRRAKDTLAYALKKYPGSPIRQKLLALQIELALDDYDKADKDKAIDALNAMNKYIKQFPDDHEMQMLYGATLESSGRHEDSQAAYRRVYILAGPLYKDAFELLENKKLTNKERLIHARALVKAHKYPAAEPHLRELLGGSEKTTEITRLFARTLFRQKKYSESIEYLDELGSMFNLARAYIRSGDRESFHSTVRTRVARKHKDAPRLLIALADESRRVGAVKKALVYLDNAITTFPESREDAYWVKAWIYYSTGKFERAEHLLRYMRRKFKKDKYAYWAARARQRMEGDPMPLLTMVKGTGYYSLLASMRKGEMIVPSEAGAGEIKTSRRLRRADILIGAGLHEDARIELRAVAARTRPYRELIKIARRMVVSGDYNEAQKLMIRVPEGKRPDDILYPMAFMHEVEKAASDHGLDPFLMLSLMREESRFDKEAFSPSGAMGLMQLMPDTARRHARGTDIALNNDTELFSPEINITIGSLYFSRLVSEFGSVSPSLAAYNAGERTVRKWLKQFDHDSYDEFVEDIPYKETRDYVKRIIRSYERYISTSGLMNSPSPTLNLL